MVDFRRCILAMAVAALFAGLASAQVGGTGQTQLTCATNVSVTPHCVVKVTPNRRVISRSIAPAGTLAPGARDSVG